MRPLLITLITLLFYGRCLSQVKTANLHFNLLSIKDGMPEGQVIDLLQDKEGYIWAGTQEGLVRYDGYTPKVYDFGIKDPYARRVDNLFENSKGQLWAGIVGGLYKYDREVDRFTQYLTLENSDINSLIEDNAGNLWFFTSGISQPGQLIRFDPVNKRESLFGINVKGKQKINAKNFYDLFKDKQQRIWVGTSNGLYEYNPKNGSFIPHFTTFDSTKQFAVNHIQEDASQPGIFYFDVSNPNTQAAIGFGRYNSITDSFSIVHHDAKNKNSVGSDTIWQVQNDSKGRLWILTGAGLSLLNSATETFTNFPSDAFKSQPYGASIAEDRQGNLWLSSGMGLIYFDTRAGQITRYSADGTKNGLADNRVHNLVLDRSGILWFGAAQEGIQSVDVKHHRFTTYSNDNSAEHQFKGGLTYAFAKASDGTIWLGTRYGLYHWIPGKDSFHLVKFNASANDSTPVLRLYYDSRGLLWLFPRFPKTGKYGLFCYNPTTGKTINYPHRASDTTSISSDYVTSIFEDHTGDIWIGTIDSGICRFNRHSQSFTRFPFIHNDNTISNTHGALDDAYVISIYEDKEGTLWVGTNLGALNRFNRQQGTFSSYVGRVPGFGCVININEDRQGRLWAGTFFGGLFELDKSRNSIKRFTEKQGLLYDGVMATAEDNAGNIWITSVRGISILNPGTGQVRRITDVTNLSRYNYSMLKTTTAGFLIGTNTGFVSLNPSDYAADTAAPVVRLEELRLSALEGNKRNDSVLEMASNQHYHFHYNENRLTFRYVGLYYPDAANTQYAYKLDGYDKAWVSAGTQRSVTYTNLAPGTYTFHVKAANSDGIWSEKEEPIVFTISPPWWKTWWAYMLYGVVLIAAIWLFIVYRSRQLKRANKLLEEKVAHRTKQLKESIDELKVAQAQLIQSEKMASLGELTAGIAHEIQNPLNFVNNFSEINAELIDEAAEELKAGNREETLALLSDIKENERKISHHGKRADGIVKSMLEHSRTSKGERQPTNINALADEYLRLAYHGLRAKDKAFNAHLETSFDEGLGKINIVSQDMGRVFLNLFNNAFYAVDEKKQRLNGSFEPRVSVVTKKENERIVLKVADNGNGIPQKVLDKIFQPFFTTKPTGQGTGLGLSLSYDIIKAHGGEIKAESKEGEGTTFVITLPA